MSRGRRDGGFALLVVLWTVTLLTVVAGSFAFAMRSETSLARNLVERAAADALAAGGIEIGIARLLEGDPERRWRVDGSVNEIEIAGHAVRVSLRSELGKVDLNRGAEALVRAVVGWAAGGDEVERESSGAEPGSTAPEALADAVLDWRDINRNRRLNGAEDPDYAAAGRIHGSRDGPFASVQELTQVLGMTEPVFERLTTLVTVYSGRARIDPASAPREVLLALPGVLAENVEAYLEARESAASSRLAPNVQLLGGGALVGPAAPVDRPRSGAFTVVAEARSGAAVSRRAAVVRVRAPGRRARIAATSGRVTLYSVLAWADGVPASFLPDSQAVFRPASQPVSKSDAASLQPSASGGAQR